MSLGADECERIECKSRLWAAAHTHVKIFITDDARRLTAHHRHNLIEYEEDNNKQATHLANTIHEIDDVQY